MDSPYHVPVLCDEALDLLMTDPTKTYVDGTVGGGGHSERIAERLRDKGRLICIDADDDAIRASRKCLERFGDRIAFVHGNFGNINDHLKSLGVQTVAGLLLDLGVSSHQLDDEAKGFSFRGDERLDMRMDRRQALTALEIVNRYEERPLADLLWRYGEERNSRRIAKHIVAARPVETTGALKNVIASTVSQRFLTKTLARVFQALRIEVNSELQNLGKALTDALEFLEPEGRMVMISYHSLEDRIVKEFFKRESARLIRSGHKFTPDITVVPRLQILTKKPVEPGEEELRVNPRGRSAKMRAAKRLSG